MPLSLLPCFVTFFFLMLGIFYFSFLSPVPHSRVRSDMQSYTINEKGDVVEWHWSNGENVSLPLHWSKIERKRVQERHTKFDTLRRHDYESSRLEWKICNGEPVFSEDLDNTLSGQHTFSGMRKKLRSSREQSSFGRGSKDSQQFKTWELQGFFAVHQTLEAAVRCLNASHNKWQPEATIWLHRCCECLSQWNCIAPSLPWLHTFQHVQHEPNNGQGW